MGSKGCHNHMALTIGAIHYRIVPFIPYYGFDWAIWNMLMFMSFSKPFGNFFVLPTLLTVHFIIMVGFVRKMRFLDTRVCGLLSNSNYFPFLQVFQVHAFNIIHLFQSINFLHSVKTIESSEKHEWTQSSLFIIFGSIWKCVCKLVIWTERVFPVWL